MNLAFGSKITSDFLANVEPSVSNLNAAHLSFFDRLRVKFGNRYFKTNREDAGAYLKAFFEHEFTESQIENNPFETTYFLKLDEKNNVLMALIKLSSPNLGGGTWYGIAVVKISADEFLIDKSGLFAEFFPHLEW